MQPFFLPYSVRQRLGHASDVELAKQASCSAIAIAGERDRLCIPPHPSDAVQVENLSSGSGALPSSIHDSAVVALLGSMTDAELSRRTGIPAQTIFKARTYRGIPRCIRKRPGLQREVQALLGTMTDTELSRQTGVSVSSICKARTSLGISKYSPAPATPATSPETQEAPTAPSLPDLDDEGLRFLGWASDVAISKKLKITTWTVAKLRARYGIPGLRLRSEPPEGLLDDLGKFEDERIAERYEISVKWVRKLRKKRGVAAYRDQNPTIIPQEALDMLGKVSDRALAKQFGLHAANYVQARKDRGIAPYQPKDRSLYEAELGTGLKDLLTWASDAEVERQTGISVFKIKKYREAHDIPLLGLRRCPPPGLIEAVRLGDHSDAALAVEFESSVATVTAIRAKLEANGT
ncbi:hypothetical protein NPS53_09320 [Pseudomonas putida]|uniref:hypothetical protein n=1 Tax=Pseudomonas putida TaxID=303 RepID=UPI002363FE72|nr:hypothetical protein [Pseudomonas putida]MDD2139776.1 hypothetical protein [Pseudomonas putida]HDS1721700.1 hypothetical protein [Pseudomonas putida]